jgi:hypothetical protein
MRGVEYHVAGSREGSGPETGLHHGAVLAEGNRPANVIRAGRLEVTTLASRSVHRAAITSAGLLAADACDAAVLTGRPPSIVRVRDGG